MAATGATAALTTKLQEESLSEGRPIERTHCCRIRDAITENGDLTQHAMRKRYGVKGSLRRMRTTRSRAVLRDVFVPKINNICFIFVYMCVCVCV